jgi:hypothetical protein
MTRGIIVIAAGLALTVTLPAVSAQAQSPRTFVSAAGSDSNPCTFAAPCRHFQAAVNATSAGGEVDALDPAGYSPITINQAITIEGQGWSYIAPPAGGNAITINAGSGNVTLRGLSLNGAGVTGPTNGIVFNSGGGLTVDNCVIQNFSNNGILMQPPSGSLKFAITNTTLTNNALTGFFYSPPTGSTLTSFAALDRVTATDNGSTGIAFNTAGLTTGGATTISITNSTSSNNGGDGFFLSTQLNTIALTGSIDNATANNNGIAGISVRGAASVTLSRSTVTGNTHDGVADTTTAHTFYTFGNNQIALNNPDGASVLNNAVYSLH